MTESIDEGMFLSIGGVEQWVTLRGRNIHNPVLFIVGGTGVALSRMALFFAPWEQDFTVAQWDQPGSGATAAKNPDDREIPMTLDRISRDGIEVVETITHRLRARKVILVAMSGGTIVGVTIAQRRPDLLWAYVGTGQIVNWSRQERLSYAMVLEQARQRNDESAAAELEAIGTPPYPDPATDAVRSKYAVALTDAERRVFADLDPSVMAAARTPPHQAHYVPEGLARVDQRAQSMATYEKLRSEIAGWDARSVGLVFRIPMFFFQGDQDAYTVTSEVQRYVAEIHAPKKMLVLMNGGGHSSMFMREEFLLLLNTHVRHLAE